MPEESISITFRLNRDDDADVLDLLNSVRPNRRSRLIRDRLRQTIEQSDSDAVTYAPVDDQPIRHSALPPRPFNPVPKPGSKK